MKYIVNLAIRGHYEVAVDANSFEEAKELAVNNMDADFGDLKNFDFVADSAEDENGARKYYL